MGKSSAGREAKRARIEEEAREKMIRRGSGDIRGQFAKQFDDKYWEKALAAQTAATQDDFDTQWKNASSQLQAALMRAGLYDSTEGDVRTKAAEKEKGQRDTDRLQRSLAAVEGRKNSVFSAEDAVLGQLRSSGDLAAAQSTAASQVALQSAPLPYSPLGSIFTDFTAGLAEQGEQERQGTNRYNLGISGFGQGRRRYTSNVG